MGLRAVMLARELKPDILLLDLAMLKHPELGALRELSVPSNATPEGAILLTAAAEKSQIIEALQLGARGAVLGLSHATVIEVDSNGHGGGVFGSDPKACPT